MPDGRFGRTAASPTESGHPRLDGVTGAPRVVVREILAGSKTTARTTTAITAVQTKWPGARVVVVGPFGSADRKSAAAARSVALAAKATFLDPVTLAWRKADTWATLTAPPWSRVHSLTLLDGHSLAAVC